MKIITVEEYINDEGTKYIAVRKNNGLVRLFFEHEAEKAIEFSEKLAEAEKNPKQEPKVLHTITIND